MEVLLEALMNPGTMTRSQWLLLAIMLFIFVGSVYFVLRLYRIIMGSRKSAYVPNIGLKRMGASTGARGGPSAGASSDASTASRSGEKRTGETDTGTTRQD